MTGVSGWRKVVVPAGPRPRLAAAAAALLLPLSLLLLLQLQLHHLQQTVAADLLPLHQSLPVHLQ